MQNRFWGLGPEFCFWCKISPKCEISFWGLRPAFVFFFVGEKFRQNLKSAFGTVTCTMDISGNFWKFLGKIAKKVRVLDWIRQI
jgi:hypothetical protein